MAKRKQDVFDDSEVQGLLKKLTGLNYQKIFRTQRIGEKIEEKAVYQFLTDQELERIQKETEVKSLEKLQMPPVMDVRKPAGLRTSCQSFFDTSWHSCLDLSQCFHLWNILPHHLGNILVYLTRFISTFNLYTSLHCIEGTSSP